MYIEGVTYHNESEIFVKKEADEYSNSSINKQIKQCFAGTT